MSDRPRIAIIAAAGRGTRFLDARPKVLADIAGRPALARVADTVEAALGEHRQLIVVGHRGAEVQAALGAAEHRCYVNQAEPRGTGDALRRALDVVDHEDADVYFLCGDKPLLRADTLAALRHRFAHGDLAMAFLTGRIDGDPADSRQGRVVMTADGEALGIVERKVIDALEGELTLRDAAGRSHRFTRAELLAIEHVNVSTYVWRLEPLRRLSAALSDGNAAGELLVTDLVALFNAAGLAVGAMPLRDAREGLGVDTVEQWREVEAQWVG
jgi:bifunctional UDP-N-acetylglucosamine pyrophosphorylase/glucosamine-1-phosphate N-acetyltransferase